MSSERRRQIHELVVARLGTDRELVGPAVEALPDLLGEDETVLDVALAERASSRGVLAATDRRLLFIRRAVRGADFDAFDYGSGLSLRVRGGTGQSTLAVHSAGTEHAFRVAEGSVWEFAANLRRAATAAGRDTKRRGEDVPPAPDLDDLIEMRDAGLLTDDEFRERRARLRGRG